MRFLGLCLVSLCLFAIGCDQPKETVPTVVPTVEPSSGTTGDDHAGHDHGDEAKPTEATK